MTYFQHLTPLQAGQTVRAAPLNTLFEGIQTAFEFLPDFEVSEKGFNSTLFVLPAVSLTQAVNLGQLHNWPTATPSPLVDLGANRLTNALDPTELTDLTTKNYVDSIFGSLTSAQVSAANALTSENNAAVSEDFALSSENASAVSESIAITAATNASVSEVSAAEHETNSATNATNALSSAAEALTSKNSAATSETNSAASAASALNNKNATDVNVVGANNSAIAAATSEANALTSENKAADWANELEDVPVEAGKFSALHWASKAQASAGGNIPISQVDSLQAALDAKVDDDQLLTNVPVNALFSDTVYTHPPEHSIAEVSELQSSLDAKLNDPNNVVVVANKGRSLVVDASGNLSARKKIYSEFSY